MDDAEEEEETHSQQSEVSSDDSDSSLNKGGVGGKKAGDKGIKSLQGDGDGQSSVTTRINKTERNYFVLRTAIDEKFIPTSIKNLRLAAYFIFLILIILSGKLYNPSILKSFPIVIYFVIHDKLINDIKKNSLNISDSEFRQNYMIDVTSRTRTLIMINEGLLNFTTSGERTGLI